MSLRPIDMQTPVQRSPEVHRTSGNEGRGPEVAQQQFAEKFQKEVAHGEQSVAQSERSEQNGVDKDGKGQGGGEAANKRKKRQERKGPDVKQNKSSSMFDVSI